MKRKPKYSGQHRAQSPARATQVLTAAIILAIIALCLWICWAICMSHEIGGSVNEAHPQLPQASAPAAPLGGETFGGRCLTTAQRSEPTTHILVDEPLLYETAKGGSGDVECKPLASKSLDTAPQQRDRPAIEMMQNAVVEAQQARVRADLVARIDNFLAGSPLAGLGECMMANAERTGVWVMLCPAQAYAESSLGAACCYPFQAWGMYGVHPSSWEDAITRYFDNIVKHWGPVQDAHELVNPDYCEPPFPYCDNVQGLAESI